MAFSEEVTLIASTTSSSSSATAADGTAYSTAGQYRRGTFCLVTSDGTGSGSFTLDVAIQAYIFGSWTDVARFNQATGNGTRILWDVGGTVQASSTIEETSQDLAITVGTKRAGPWGSQIRATYTITITGTYSITWYVRGVLQS